MLYLNQQKRPDLRYPTALDDPDNETFHNGTIKMAGCGLCSLCMMVDRLCEDEFTLHQAMDLSHAVGADRHVGTDLEIMIPAVCEMYDLTCEETDDAEKMVACLKNGGCVVVNIGGDRPDYESVFCYGGHYMTIISADEKNELCVLDSWLTYDRIKKYEDEGRVRRKGNLLFCSLETMELEAADRSPSYFLFRRK